MRKPRIKKRRNFWIVQTCRKDRAICYSFKAALRWKKALEGGART